MTQRAPRFPAKYDVVLRHGPEMFSSQISNISIGGACLMGIQGVRKGDQFTIDYTMGQQRATVTWTIGQMAGVKFSEQLSESVVQSIRAGPVPIPFKQAAAG